MFELLNLTVDGQPRPIRRSSRRGSQTYSVSLGDDLTSSSERVTIAYTYRTLIPVSDQLLRLRVDQPTKRLTIDLDYTRHRPRAHHRARLHFWRPARDNHLHVRRRASASCRG